MCGVLAVLAEAHRPERLKDICQKQDIGATVQVAVVSQGLAPKGRPDLRMGVVLVTDMRIGELAVEGFLLEEFGLREAIPDVHILVRVNTLSYKEHPSFSVGLVLGSCWARVGLLSEKPLAGSPQPACQERLARIGHCQ